MWELDEEALSVFDNVTTNIKNVGTIDKYLYGRDLRYLSCTRDSKKVDLWHVDDNSGR